MSTPLKEVLLAASDEEREKIVRTILEEGKESMFAQLLMLRLDRQIMDALENLVLQHGQEGQANCAFLAGALRGTVDIKNAMFPPKELEEDRILEN